MTSGNVIPIGVRCTEYRQLDWCDLISGTKEQLQSFGLGVGLAYPGEVGGPRKLLKVQDVRGYAVEIARDALVSKFNAYVRFPGWPEHPDIIARGLVDSGHEGVSKRCNPWNDEFLGSGEALVAAGLVRRDQLPGQPGMRSSRVTILADGTVHGLARESKGRRATEAGARCIERASQSSFRVKVWLPKDEAKIRQDDSALAEHQWRQQVRALPRPPRLQAGTSFPCATPSQPRVPPAHSAELLHLVWSATADAA